MKITKNAVVLILTVLIALLGVILFKDERYNLVIILIVMLSCVPFYFKYEHDKPKTREVVVLAIMIALTVISRIIFMITPSFKPVTVMVIICGVVFGRASGFMCGSLSALLSDFVFGIGPWTPFQMLAWGIIGILFVEKLHPFVKSKIEKLTNKISTNKQIILLYIFLIIISIDFVLSCIKYLHI